MMRRVSFICLAVLVVSGLYTFRVKSAAERQVKETASLLRQAKEVRNHAALLHAEYDWLSDSDRLKELADQVLKLAPTEPKQYASLGDLDKHLPGVAPLPAPPAPPQQETRVEPAPPPAPAEQPKPELASRVLPPPQLSDKTDKPAAPTDGQLARLTQAPGNDTLPQKPAAPISAPVAALAPPAAIKQAKPVVADNRAPSPLAPPSFAPARPAIQTAQSVAAPRPVPAVTALPPAPAAAPAPFVGSALGMTRMRAAPARYTTSGNDGE